MEPVALLSFVVEAAGLLEGVSSAQLKKRTRKWRVARAAAQAATADGVVISSHALRAWLAREDSIRLLELRTEQALSDAARSLSLVLVGATTEERTAGAYVILAHILRAYVEDLNPSAAARMTAAWVEATVKHEGSTTRESITNLDDHLQQRLDARDSFAENLRVLPPLVSETATRLRPAWPGIERLIAEVAMSPARPGLLREWGVTAPAWMEHAPALAHAILGTLAASYGEATAATEHYLRAAAGGAVPRAYFIARAGQCAEAADDHERALRLLSEVQDQHPYAAALLAGLEKRFDDAERYLAGWQPAGAEQSLQKGILTGGIQSARGDFAAAIATYEEAGTTSDTAGALIESARLLLHRGAVGQTMDRLADARHALRLALKARSGRRVWSGDSVEPTELAVVASVMSGDTEGAWRLTRPFPEGDAQDQEANDHRIRGHAAMTAALTGRIHVARELVADIGDEFTRLSVLAVLAENGEVVDPQYPDAATAWKAAALVAKTDSERLQAARALADEGISTSGLQDLENDYPAVVQEIRAVATAMAGGEDQLVRLRANAHVSPGVAAKLAEVHHREGRPDEAARVLRDAGERWANQHLMVMAADEYRQAGQPKQALEAAHRALALSGHAGPGIHDANILLVELYSNAGEWPKAAEAARALVALDEADVSARWALTRCLHAQRDFEQAWYALTATGRAVEPRSPEEALVWLDLCGRYAPRDRLFGLLLDALPKWKNDEVVFAAFIQVFLMTPGESAKASEPQAQAIRDAISEFTEQFPESTRFYAVTVDEQDPLAGLQAELIRHDRDLSPVDEAVRDGRLPLGVLAFAAGRTYTEASLRRAAGVVFAHDVQDKAESVGQALSGAATVVIDPTAGHTLALLSSTTTAFLVGVVPAATTTDSLFDDALLARDALSHRSTLTVGWDSATNAPVVSEISDADAEQLATRSALVVQLMSRFRRLPRRELRHFDDAPSLRNAAWLSGLDLALELGAPYWSDDLVLRRLARQRGLQTFGTLALMEWARRSPGAPSKEVLEAEAATLLSNYYVSLPFSLEVWRLSAAEDGWKPRGAAAALERVGIWSSPASVVQFVLEALREVQAVDAEAVRDWIASAAVGLGKIAGNDGAAIQNVTLFGETVLVQPWLSPQHMHFVFDGLRAAARVLGLRDPIEDVLRRYYARLVAVLGHVVASAYLRALVAQAQDADQRIVARVILTEGFNGEEGSGATLPEP